MYNRHIPQHNDTESGCSLDMSNMKKQSTPPMHRLYISLPNSNYKDDEVKETPQNLKSQLKS